MTSAAGTETGSGLSEGLRGHSSSLNSFTRPEKRVCPPSMRASARAGPSRSRSLPAPSNLQSWQSSIPSGRNACTAGPRVWPGRAGLTEARGAERRSKKLSLRLATAQQTGQRSKKTPADASSPRLSQSRSTRQHNPNRKGIRMYIFCLPWQENC